MTADELCVPGYSQGVRNVPQSEKNRVYAEYGIRHHKPGSYEVDHLISLELGGSNSIKNLWPEKQPGASLKGQAREQPPPTGLRRHHDTAHCPEATP